jgi:hypothetical protein
MTDDPLEHAVNLIKSGDIDQGGKILASLLKENQKLERAWVWLYPCVKTDEQRIYCLKKVIELNPDHEKAKLALEKLIEQQIRPISSETKSPEPKIQNVAEPKIEQKPEKETKRKIKREPFFQHKSKKMAKGRAFEPIKVAFIKPTIIFNKPDENPYAKTKYASSDFPDIDTSMFGNSLAIGGIHINAHDYPECISAGYPFPKSQCHICEFFTASDCPIQRDPTILREVRVFFAQNVRNWQEDRDRRDAKIDAIYSELKAHGRPLHYEVVAKIMKDRYPKLRLNANMILHLMGRHPEKFEWVDIGVYKAK